MIRKIIYPCLFMLALAVPAAAQDYSIDFYKIAGGGEIESEGGNWTLSGTFGQWDVDTAAPLSGGAWELVGGFWGVNLETDVIFKDGFES